MKKLCSLIFSICLLSVLILDAQEANSLSFRAGLKSPEVTSEGVTFRFKAPKARRVQVSTSWNGYDATKGEMKQGANGIWEVTLPLPSPELYTYTFVADGMSTLDPANVFVQRDGSKYLNAVIIEGGYADVYKESTKPGNLEQVWYYSAENDMTRRLYVYTPNGYDHKNKKVKYPVLYLLHGGGGDEDAWSTLGRTCQILDNLIAEGKAEPMIVVMPNGNPNQYAAQTLGIPVKENIRQYESGYNNYSSLTADIVPFIDKTYNTIAKRNGRAVAGLSMGGGQAFFLAFNNIATFANVGVFSAGLIGATALGLPPFDAEATVPGIFTNKAKFNKFDVIYLSCGEQDGRIDGMMQFRDDLKAKGYNGVHWEQYPGGHEWKVWRRNLTSFVQLIFK